MLILLWIVGLVLGDTTTLSMENKTLLGDRICFGSRRLLRSEDTEASDREDERRSDIDMLRGSLDRR